MKQLAIPTEPIPLAAPDGTVYAYACPRCRQVRMMGSVLCRADDETVRHLAEESKSQADSCCRCRRCGAELAADRFGYCAVCDPIEKAEQDERTAAFLQRDGRRAAALELRLAACKDRDAAGRLVAKMRDLSEECWCAGWLMGLEFSLWRMVSGEDGGRFGQGDVTAEDVAELRRLHETCGGWWHWDDDLGGEMFVTTEEWLKMYAEAKSQA